MSLKILILLLYYNRPKLVRNTLASVQESTYKNWHIAFIDDASDFPGEPIVREMFNEEELAKVTFYNIEDTKEAKMARGGSLLGSRLNHAMWTIPADVVVFGCDDDAMRPDYMENLNKYFQDNPETMYAYSHIIPYNPHTDDWRGLEPAPGHWLNKTGMINPFCQVDAAQVAWRRDCAKTCGFVEPRTANLDAEIFGQLHEQFGLAPFTGFYAGCKGLFENQLGNHSSYDKVD